MSLVFPNGRSFYMLRHAETEDNKNKVVSGKASNTTLTEKGKKQAISMRDVIASIRPAIGYIVTSEMQRTIDTADIICEFPDLRNLHRYIDSGVNERAYGEAEGISDAIRSKMKKEGSVIDGEETKEHLRVRTVRAIIANLNHKDGIPLFITHGGNIRRIIEESESELSKNIEKIVNCGLYEFITPRSKNGQWQARKVESV